MGGANEGNGACDDAKQDKDLASPSPPGLSQLPAVREVSEVRKLASLRWNFPASGVSYPPQARVTGFSMMSYYEMEDL